MSDVVLGLCGVIVAAPSLAYPVSWDMSVHIYVAREWLLRGAMPYRDTFDHKGPGLYALHAVALALFGDAMWGFRLLELAGVVALGIVCAWLTAPPNGRPAPGVRGVAVLSACVFAFGFLDYWNTAQGELIIALLTSASVLAARRLRNPRAGAALAGLLGGAAVVVKPTALPLLLIALVVSWKRGRREGRATSTLGWFAGSLLVLPTLTVAYFASRGALGPAVDVLVFANRVYVTHEHTANDLRGALHACALASRHFGPAAYAVSLGSALGVVWSIARRRRRDVMSHGIALAMLALGFVTVVMQWKFFLYHWSIAAGGVVLAMANLTVYVRRIASAIRLPALAAPAVAAAMWLSFVRTGNEDYALWRDNASLTARWACGAVDDDTFARRIARAPGKRDYYHLRKIGIWIREHSTAADYVLVRDEAAEIYVISGRRAPGRFFWSVFLTSPTRAYHRDAWLREDKRAIDAHAPRWVVVRRKLRGGAASAAWFAPLGYRTACSMGEWVILGRTPPGDPALEARAR